MSRRLYSHHSSNGSISLKNSASKIAKSGPDLYNVVSSANSFANKYNINVKSFINMRNNNVYTNKLLGEYESHCGKL